MCSILHDGGAVCAAGATTCDDCPAGKTAAPREAGSNWVDCVSAVADSDEGVSAVADSDEGAPLLLISIIGGLVGALVLALACAAFCYKRRRNRKSNLEEGTAVMSGASATADLGQSSC